MIQETRKAYAQEVGGITLMDVARALFRGKWLIMAMPVLFLLPAVLYVKAKKPLYQSTSKFICRTAGQSGGGNMDLLARIAGFGQGGGTASDPSAYFVDILKDEDFLSKLNERRWPYKSDSINLSEVWELDPDKSKADWERKWRYEVVSMLRNPKRVNLVKNRGNGVFVLDTYFESPELSQELNRGFIRLLTEYIRQDLLSNTRTKRIFIEGRLSDVEAELRRNEDAVTNFLERNKSIDSPQLLAQRVRLTRAQNITQEIYLQLRKEYEAAKIEELRDLPLIEVISKPTYPQAKAKGKEIMILAAACLAGILTGVLSALALHLVPWRRLWAEFRAGD